MKAFVRFRQAFDDEGECWVAWFEPAHRVLARTAPFFANRFTTMRWSILTPDGSCFWDGKAMSFGPPAEAADAPQEDEVEEFWKTYYASTFNPARLKTKTMQGEMPKRYWKNLPEAALIPELVAASAVRTETMVATPAHRAQRPSGQGHLPSQPRRGFRGGLLPLQPRRAAPRGSGLPSLPAVARCDARRLRRGPVPGEADDRGRTAGRSGGSGRTPLRRSGGQLLNDACGGGHRPR
jgi:hypothetical protein